MARGQVDLCILCGCAPCECAKQEKPAKLPTKRAKPVMQTVQLPTAPAPQVQSVAGLTTSQQAVAARNEEELARIEEARALTVLFRSEMVAWQDVQRLGDKCNIEPKELRLLVWRLRRRQGR